MDTLVEQVLRLLRAQAPAADWAALLAEAVVFEQLRVKLSGREAVAERLGGSTSAHLDWARIDGPGVILLGTPRAGTYDRGLAVTVEASDGAITRITRQGMAAAPRPGAPMAMDASVRERLDKALERDHPMSIAYVDPQGRPHLSMRGSILTFGSDRLAMWARPGSGLAASVPHNPNVALMFRDPTSRATYLMNGRAHVAQDEATRAQVFAMMPEVERQHDFALLGAAIVIELDVVEGYAGFGQGGAVEPIRLVRSEG